MLPDLYGIRCIVTGMVYVGSTQDQHLITGKSSSLALQQAIQSYGLSKFTVVVFEVVEFPTGLSYQSRKLHLVELFHC